ncbi:uncharacterized protein LOC134245678 isoform X2 [Saccostrea cucullata]|uniref:uncharacterized protein LOC134245678 isoform X2 n=1 Tax=Saccostrea cuccullata TaxID=36930 RepID=UPI002ED0A821
MDAYTGVFLWIIFCFASVDVRKVSEKPCTIVPSGEKCRAILYKDCTEQFLQREYPGLYYHGNTTMAAPGLSISTVHKLYGAPPEFKWYSEVNINIQPNTTSTERIQGFEAWIESIDGKRCIVLTLSNNGTLSTNNSMREFEVWLKLRMSANITVWQLPRSTSSSPTRGLIRAGINQSIPPNNSYSWYTEILFRNNSRDRIVEIQFQSAPESYGIKYYNIKLRRVTPLNNMDASYRTTTHAWIDYVLSPWVYVKFKDVKPGTYEIMVEPYDDLKVSGRTSCRCKKSSECFPCRSTLSPKFTITEFPSYTSEAGMKTSVTVPTLTSSDPKKLDNKPKPTNNTTLIRKQQEIFNGSQSTGGTTLIETPHKVLSDPHSNDDPSFIKTPNRVSSRSQATDITTKTPKKVFKRPTSDSKIHIKTLNRNSNIFQSTSVQTVAKTPKDIFTQSFVSFRPSSTLDSSLSEVSENNSQLERNFEEVIEESGSGSQPSGKTLAIPASVLSVLGITLGALASIFAVVKFKRRGPFVDSKSSSPNPARIETSVLIVHDVKHSDDAKGLMSLIINDLHISVNTLLFPNKSGLINNSDSSIIVLWMNLHSFTKFECRFLKDKEIPSITQTLLQSRFVVIESRNTAYRILPRIQYWTKFVLDTELDLFLDFLRNNVKQEPRKSWTTNDRVITEIPETPKTFPIPYNRMDSGIHSEYENETDFPFLEDKSQEECSSIAAVTIGEYQMGVPFGYPNKVTASFPQFTLSNSATSKHSILLKGCGKSQEISRLNTRENFIPPENTSYYDADGSLFSEAIMIFNERNMRQTGVSEDPRSLIEENLGTLCNSINHRSGTPVCFQNMVGLDDDEEEPKDEEKSVEVDRDEEEDRSVEKDRSAVEDTISVGGLSC